MTRLIIKIVGASCAGKRHTKRILYPQAVVAGTFRVTSNTPKACQLQIVLLRVIIGLRVVFLKQPKLQTTPHPRSQSPSKRWNADFSLGWKYSHVTWMQTVLGL